MTHPPRPKVKGMLKVAALLVVVAFILFIWANVRPVPVRVQVTFIGFTNLDITYTTTNGTVPITLAYFSVSNVGKCSVFDIGWYGYDTKNKPSDSLPRLGGDPALGELGPGAFKIISLTTPPENTAPWRVSLSLLKIGWLDRKPAWVRVRGTIMEFVPAKWLDERKWEVYSDWVNGPELVPVGTNMVKTPEYLF